MQGRDPEQFSNATGGVGGVQIAPQAIALAAHLNKVCGVSYERIAEIFGQVFGLDGERSTNRTGAFATGSEIGGDLPWFD